MPKMEGRFTSGKNKGRYWQVYQDPASRTGYTRKQWDPYDPSKTEYFEDFDMAAAEADEQVAADRAARKAAEAAARAARQAKDDERLRSFWEGVQQANERKYKEEVRQFDEGMGYKREELAFRRKDAAADRRLRGRELKLKELDTRTRLKIGLRELELREKQLGTEDLRERERNVLEYLRTIGQLRLPYSELQALSQRAVAGILPGAAAPGGGPGAGGALTADQWQALATGVQRDWETRQVGQGNPLAG